MVVCISFGIIFLIIGVLELLHVMPEFLDNLFKLLPTAIYDKFGLICAILGAVLLIVGIILVAVSKAKEKKLHDRLLNAPSRPKEVEYYSPMGLDEVRAAAGMTQRVSTGSDNTLRADGSLSIAKMQGGDTKPVSSTAPLVQGGALGGISKAAAGPVDNSGLSAAFLQREKEEKAEYERVQGIYKGTGTNTNPLYNPNSGGLMMGGQPGPSVGAPDFMGTQSNTQAAMQKSPAPAYQAPAYNAPKPNYNPLTGLAQPASPAPAMNANPLMGGGNQNPFLSGVNPPVMPMPQAPAPAPAPEPPKPQGGFVLTSKGENPMLVQGVPGGMTPVQTMNPTIHSMPVQGSPSMPTMVQSAPSPIMENLPQAPVMPANMGQGTPNNNPLFRQ